MVVLKQFTSTQFTNLDNIAGRVLYDNTLNILRYNDSTTYNNILITKDVNNNVSNINDILIDGNLDITNHDRNNNIGLQLNSILVTATADELNYTQVMPGVGSASKALVLDSNRDIENINILSSNYLLAGDIGTTGNVGINTTSRLFGLEINHSTGNCLRLTYNDNDGSPSYRCDFNITSNGSLTIQPTGNNPSVSISANINSHSLSLTKQNIANNTVVLPIGITALPNTAAENGLGAGIEFSAVNSTYTIFTLGTFESYSTNVLDNNETGSFRWRLANDSVLTEVAGLNALGEFNCATLIANHLDVNTIDAGNIVESSDFRLKENINELNILESYNKILQLNPKKYNFKNNPNEECYGLIAQEVKEILPNLVKISKTDEYDDLHLLKYTSLIPHLINCIKELNKEINSLKKEINYLKYLI